VRKAVRRLWITIAAGVVLVAAAALAMTAMRDAMVFFYSPAMVAQNPPDPGQRVRVGGLVVTGSVERPPSGGANFTVTDGDGDIRILYAGSLPDLFREGQGIVAEGIFGADLIFTADTVLAKHDENYMPAEVAAALRESGQWREGEDAPTLPAGSYGGEAAGGTPYGGEETGRP
jgi:cytochrome c-type biogenesis protein CcmE